MTESSYFDADTRVEQTGEGRYQGYIDPGWNIGDNPNGGYLLSVVTSALADVLPHPDPLSVTTHYLRPGTAGVACDVDVEVIRTGRTLSTVRARLFQAGKQRLEVLAAYGDLSVPAGINSDITIPAPAMPSPEACFARDGKLQGIELAFAEKIDVMLSPETAVPGGGKAEVSGWIRFHDDRAPDPRALLLFCDSFPPSPFGRLGVIGWVPTIELTVHVRRRPAPGWIKARFVTDDLADGRMIESGCLWDSQDQLVAEARQLGLVRSGD